MNTKFLNNVLTAILLVFIWSTGYAQKTFTVQNDPLLKIEGTSSLHDWEMPSNQASGNMVATENSGQLGAIESLQVRMPAESIKSGKKAMDKKAYDAIKTNRHKEVVYKLREAVKKSNGWTFKGSFEIAGKTRDVEIQIAEQQIPGGYRLSGEYAFKLSDFDITPPTALMGSIKTGDEVKISFDLEFKS